MKKTVLLAFVLVLLSTAVIMRFTIPVTASLPVHNIDTGLDYVTIQEAVNAPETSDGHTILVDAGTYYEHVVVNKSISLIGENRSTTIIDGNGIDTVVRVTANNTVVRGFTIQDGHDGIELAYCFKSSVLDNNVKNNNYGIGLWYSSICSVSDNNIINNGFIGVHACYSANCSIRDNYVNNNLFGIDLIFSFNCSVSGNNVTNFPAGEESGYAIALCNSPNCSLSRNEIISNRVGIVLDQSSDNILRNNNMTGNRYSFEVSGNSTQHYIQDIDTSNTVDGKPIYYLMNQNNLTLGPSTHPSIGYLALVNSTNITVEDLTLQNSVFFAFTTSSTIQNVTVSNSTNSRFGIWLAYSSNCSIYGNNVNRVITSIVLYHSLNCSIHGNNATNNEYGVLLYGASKCSVYGNNLSYNCRGIELGYSSNNSISGNNITKNWWNGIVLGASSNNIIYHNNFVDNYEQMSSDDSTNVWDNGYPSGGNYWSDYTDVDLYSGPYQNETGSDGMGDTSYVIDANNTDRYPLMGPFSFFNAGTWNEVTYYVHTVSNSTVSDFNFNPDNYLISFNVTGPDHTVGFCTVTIPKELLWCDDSEQWEVWVNNTLIEDRKVMEDTDYTYIYFTYNQSTQNVEVIGVHVIPEFPTWTSLLLVFVILTVAIAIYKRRLLKTPIH